MVKIVEFNYVITMKKIKDWLTFFELDFLLPVTDLPGTNPQFKATFRYTPTQAVRFHQLRLRKCKSDEFKLRLPIWLKKLGGKKKISYLFYPTNFPFLCVSPIPVTMLPFDLTIFPTRSDSPFPLKKKLYKAGRVKS